MEPLHYRNSYSFIMQGFREGSDRRIAVEKRFRRSQVRLVKIDQWHDMKRDHDFVQVAVIHPFRNKISGSSRCWNERLRQLPARVIKALYKRQLQTVRSKMVRFGPANKQFMTSHRADFFDLHFFHAESKLWNGQSEGWGGRQIERDLIPAEVGFLVVLSQRVSD